MTRNEKLAEISIEAYAELCLIADKHRGKFKPIYGEGANEKWWCVLYPAVHISLNKEFNTGSTFGLTFPTCDISQLPLNLGSRFIFPTRESVSYFGVEAYPWFVPFLYPEITLRKRAEEEEEPVIFRRTTEPIMMRRK